MSLPRVRVDPDTGYAYIYLAEPYPGIAAASVPLGRHDVDDPEVLDNLVLDFDRDGRLVGIEVVGPARRALRRELLDGGA